jgi:hypothetical protein
MGSQRRLFARSDLDGVALPVEAAIGTRRRLIHPLHWNHSTPESE